MIFSFKKGGGDGKGDSPFQPQPDKAQKFFDHANTVVAGPDVNYGLSLFAQGIAFDPGNMVAHQNMYLAAVRYNTEQGKPATGKELRSISNPSSAAVTKFAIAEFAWMKELNSLASAVRTLERAAEAGQIEFGQWAAPKVMNMVRSQAKKKPSKSLMVAAMNAFKGVNAWNEAFTCGEEAVKIDPTDGELVSELKQLTAARAIQQGGYAHTANQQGGFRQNVRDLDKQRALEEAESLAGGADVETRNLDRAKKEFDENPLSLEAIRRYGQLLKRKQSAESDELAIEVFSAGFSRTGDYSLKVAASDIKIGQMRREARALREKAEAAPGDEEAKAAADSARDALLQHELNEYKERIAKYPTDRTMKAEAGRVAFEMGNIDDAIGFFQQVKEEPRMKVYALHMLGKCYHHEGWHSEAISEYRDALASIDATTSEREQEIRYDLMISLMEQGRIEKSMALIQEAKEICSVILRTDISYRDIKAKRRELDQLAKELG